VAALDFENEKPGFKNNRVRNHRVVDWARVFPDTEVLLNGSPGIGQECSVWSHPGAVFVSFRQAVGADRDKPAIGDLHFSVELDQ
jgi:hypothetical protein